MKPRTQKDESVQTCDALAFQPKLKAVVLPKEAHRHGANAEQGWAAKAFVPSPGMGTCLASCSLS